MSKSFNIDWEIKTMLDGKCVGVGCPIKKNCLRYTTKDWNPECGRIRPPYTTGGQFPKRCKDYISNAPFKPLIKTVEIQD